MLAGAVSGCDGLIIDSGFEALGALSPSGRSRPFQRGADGLVPAEGAALLALMRLRDAVAARVPVLGVVRGIGLSNDGRTGGFLAPAEEGQIRAMRAAYEQAGFGPETVELLECHATGTPLGDAVEARSTARLFRGRHGAAAHRLGEVERGPPADRLRRGRPAQTPVRDPRWNVPGDGRRRRPHRRAPRRPAAPPDGERTVVGTAATRGDQRLRVRRQ